MKCIIRKIAMLIAVLLCTTVASAQTTQEVVYLKNGSIIRGDIIEFIPNESLKIQMADGSIFAYKMDEVQKITKERKVTDTYFSKGNNRGISSGYRGFVDLDYTWGTENFIGFSTSHGYQINPHIFMGGGIGFNYFFSEGIGIPVFAHVRSEILKNAISPFFDFKVGYSFLDTNGICFSPTVGCHFQVSNHLGLNASLGYTFQNFSYSSENCGGVSLKIGFDF